MNLGTWVKIRNDHPFANQCVGEVVEARPDRLAVLVRVPMPEGSREDLVTLRPDQVAILAGPAGPIGAAAAAATPILAYFEYAHLPGHLQSVSRPVGELAREMAETLPDGPEKSAGLRKLLEAKDCFVRAKLG